MKGEISTTVLKRIERMDHYNSWIFQRIAPFCGERILEVGCGIGNMTQFFSGRELVVGIDIDKDHIAAIRKKFAGRKNMKFECIPIEKVSTKEYSKYRFDTILCINVLEHIKNDSAALAKFKSLLSPGGRLVLQVPAFQFLYNPLDKNIYHFRRYSMKPLIKKTQKAGFQTEHCSFMNIFGIPGWFLNGTILRRKILPSSQLHGFDKVLPILKLLDKPFNRIAGLSIIYAGLKK
jgi:2-polyprenyl-3-methyl-5-hydroxy-6-metoxy-1,4-benzoquinol methylase